ncbi:MAG: PAS domain S-box protein [Desulfobacterales bacterium]|nr:MAG: PAS domain S-box protein [Desulfobacterales bacterium]
MRKFSLLTLTVFLGLPLAASFTTAATPIKVGMYQNEPLIFTDLDGKVKGIFADILQYISSEEGWSLTYVPGTWTQCLERLKDGEIDILSTIAFSNDRDKLFDFTHENILTNWGEIYTRKHSPIRTIVDLHAKKVAVLQEDIHYQALKNHFHAFGVECDFIETDNYATVLELVANETADAGVVNRLFGMKYAPTYRLGKSAIIFNPISIHLAAPKGKNRHLIAAIDEHIKFLKDQGSSIYHRSLDQWLGVAANRWVFPGWLKVLLFAGGGVLLALFLGTLILRSKVREKTREIAKELAERRQAEDLIQFQNTILATQQETSLDAILVVDDTGKVISFNQRFVDMWHIPPAILRSKSDDGVIQSLLPQVADPDQFVARIKYLYEHRDEHSFEEVELTDGRTCERYSAPMFGPDKKYYGRVWYFRDVTERKKTELALRESEENYRDIFENADQLIQSVDTHGHFHHVNKKWKETLGYSDEEVARLAVWDVLHPDAIPHCQALFSKILAGQKVDTFETVFLAKDGRSIPVEGNSNCRFEDGRPVLTRGIFRDIRERKRAEAEKAKLEAQLYRAQQMEAIGTLAGGVAHDLNNILSGIVSYPDLLLMELPEDSPLREPILTIKKSGDKAASIVQDLLTLARRGVAAMEVVSLNQIIADYLESHEFGRLITHHPHVEVEKKIDDRLLNIKGSAALLSKTLMNLVANAAEAMPDGGRISIATQNRYIDRPIGGYDQIQEGDYVVLSVTDTGVGILSQDLKRIFEPFYTRKAMGRSGAGLGMAVVWGTVKDHQGYIDVQSQRGQGTKFQLYFPATREQLSEEAKIPVENYRAHGESILIVDDVKEQREIASWMLTKLDYAVEAVASGEEAIEYLKKKPADLLVLDMIMDPGMDGFETYQKIVAISPGQKAIIASGFAENDRVKEAQKLGAGQYVRKPYTLEKIGIAIRDALDR